MHQEAIEDRVRWVKTPKMLMTRYYPKCHKCGQETMSYSYQRGVKYTCADCKLLEFLSDKVSRTSQDFESKEKKFAKAIERIERKTRITKAYQVAAEKIHNKLHQSGWFDSTEEIMVAIQLVKSGIKTRHQVQLGRYRADFVLPDYKIVLEVDGVLYHKGKEEKDKLRDQLIVLALGADWEVIRISDTLVNENITKVTQAITRVKRHREKIRKLNNGQLPRGYSDTAT